MPALVAGIHVLLYELLPKTWMAGLYNKPGHDAESAVFIARADVSLRQFDDRRLQVAPAIVPERAARSPSVSWCRSILPMALRGRRSVTTKCAGTNWGESCAAQWRPSASASSWPLH